MGIWNCKSPLDKGLKYISPKGENLQIFGKFFKSPLDSLNVGAASD